LARKLGFIAWLAAGISAHGFYNPSTGRWLSRDPISGRSPLLQQLQDEEESDLSESEGAPMRYVNNDAIAFHDGLGLWPSSSPFLGILIGRVPLTHQNANRRELPTSEGNIFVINYSSQAVDTHQHSDESYMHAMRDGWLPEPDATARGRANQYVQEELSKAERLLCNCGDAVGYLHALEFFGHALHTVQDATSPAHNRWSKKEGRYVFRKWYGTGVLPNAAIHVMRENFDPGYESALDHATSDLWKYFTCKSNAPAFPADFFTYGIDTTQGGWDY
jgi:hypothetical protein